MVQAFIIALRTGRILVHEKVRLLLLPSFHFSITLEL
jgi:hypothetical protein